MAALPLTNASFAHPKRPGQLAIVFALSVVTSKPAELNYIRLLRQHIAQGRRDNAISSAYRHLDRSSHWRSEYERAKDALQIAESETVELRMEVERLKARVESVQPAASATKKRKTAINEDIVPVPRSPKKAKRNASPGRRDGSPQPDVEGEFDFTEVGEIGNILMRSLYQVHALLKSNDRTEAAVLAHHLVQAASALPQVVQQAVKATFARPIGGHGVLKTTLTAAGKAIVSLVVGVNRLSHVTNGTEMQGQVVFAYVQMFVSLLGTLEEASELEAEKAEKQMITAAAANRPTTSKGKASAQQPKQPSLKNTPSLNAVTCFLCGIIDVLDEKVDVHKQLYEGFAYGTFNKLGTRLYTCAFGYARGLNIADEITASNQPDDIEDAGVEPTVFPPATSVGQAKMEAPYLVHLLTRLMAAAPKHLGATISTKTGKAKQSNNKGSMKGILAIHAKDRLQRTLVNCIFGTEGLDEEDPFMDCLRMPSLVGQQPLPMPKVKEAEVQEWFKGEVWRLLGWEILGKEGDW
ncbi:hypothetical protein B0A55_09524 [Friedmanniomyces simplex]|uniref:Uncharacterized protein n=1 Tax=Friedmanniomyces simplex TaxID=329884 RepID=A0A4U0WUB9_9PEZI|nr:hypothetical protein B0A55_09524 [Friedmanniomyces simplex]